MTPKDNEGLVSRPSRAAPVQHFINSSSRSDAPRLLDLFCCAGGAGEGYRRAGFHVVGVDIEAQPQNPHEFIRADVFGLDPAWIAANFDAVHASPKCQAHSSLRHMHNAKQHDNQIPATRTLLEATGLPWIIENVEGAREHMRDPITLCGTMFGLGAEGAELRRHRLFETSFSIPLAPQCLHRLPRVIGVYGGHGRDRRRKVNTQDFSTEARRQAMGIDWMNGSKLSQAIPPAYTEWLGRELLAHMMARRAA